MSSSRSPQRKVFTSSVVRAGAKAGTIQVIASSGARDRQDDTLAPGGWNLANYRKNPVVLYGHDYRSLPIGKAEVRTTAEALLATITFAEHPFAQQVYELYRAGMLNAVSVGFQPVKWVHNQETGGTDYLEQELLELSCVPVPANQEALVLARSMAASAGGGEIVLELADDDAVLEVDFDPATVLRELAAKRKSDVINLENIDAAKLTSVVGEVTSRAVDRLMAGLSGRLD